MKQRRIPDDAAPPPAAGGGGHNLLVNQVLTALITATSTLSGVVLAYFFQRASARRTERATFAAQSREQQLRAFNQFGVALLRYRQSELDRWHRWQESGETEAFRTARTENYRARNAAHEALLEVQLASTDTILYELGQTAIDTVSQVHNGNDVDGFAARKTAASAAISHFTARAAEILSTRIGPDGTLRR